MFLDPEPPAVHIGRKLECPRGFGHQGLQLLQGWDMGGSHPERSPAHINRIASSLAREALAAGFFRLCILQWRLLAHSLQLAPELLENFDLVELQLVGRALPSQQQRCEAPVRALGQAGLFFSLTRAKENKELLVQIQTQRELLFQLRRILESLTRVKQPSLCWLDQPAFRAKGVVGLEVVGSGLADLVIVGTHTSGLMSCKVPGVSKGSSTGTMAHSCAPDEDRHSINLSEVRNLLPRGAKRGLAQRLSQGHVGGLDLAEQGRRAPLVRVSPEKKDEMNAKPTPWVRPTTSTGSTSTGYRARGEAERCKRRTTQACGTV